MLRLLAPRLPWLVSSLLCCGASLCAAQQSFEPGLRADAGPDLFVVPPTTSVRMQSTLSGPRRLDPSPTETFVIWGQLSGPHVQILGADTVRPIIIPSAPGVVRLRMKAFDSAGRFSFDEAFLFVLASNQEVEIQGTRRKWHKLSLTFTHNVPLTEAGTPNPFLDLRLIVRFFHLETGKLYSVPGFFAADGNAADSGATGGTRWRVNFTPDEAGTWYFEAFFREGTGIAIDPNGLAGVATGFNGANGNLFVEPADPAAPGFLSKGRLEYVGKHHLRFAENGEAFLKSGAGSPENFLGYYEFDGTVDQGGALNDLVTGGAHDGLHHFDPHLDDYVDNGAPLWMNGKGRRICGALDYLASRGVNSLYALSYNIDGGDGREVYPWSTTTGKLRFDVSKLDQWERVLEHMTRAGIVWHVITQETENDHALDAGALGIQRKLYYRELVARFGWAPGLVWNLGEENTNSPQERRDFADYIRGLDVNAHPIAIHNRNGDINGTYGGLLGSHLELASLQSDPGLAAAIVRQLVADSEAAGRPWTVNYDEQGPANDGVVPDDVDFWHDTIRTRALWPGLLGQGGGCEWYFGYEHPNSDLDCEDFRARENMWLLTARANDFLRATVPFEDMTSADPLASGNQPNVLALRGELYLVYLPFGGASTLDLEGNAGPFLVQWFDARNGGALSSGSVTQVSGPGVVSLGLPPGSGDRVALVRNVLNRAPTVEAVMVEPSVFQGREDFALRAFARDPNGPLDALSLEAEVINPDGIVSTTLPLVPRGGRLFSLFMPAAPALAPGTWQVRVVARDSSGLESAPVLASFLAQ